ncbi:toll-like receptor 13 [Mytilus galloprovincialis]|uniref:Toll-like receptor 13 n=1 Tax=Mytilus galloprovincialis TaxID=29158 RepID=A0A8B6G0R8_MYTGA|nr:toll-like receptor 13 [Mytilus galloprovincialis]
MVNILFFCILLTITILFVKNTTSIHCVFDRRCLCYIKADLQYVNCSYTNLTSVPSLPSTVNVLNLKYNRIILLSNGSFKNLKHLLELDLSWNKLKRLELGSFTGLSNLQKLKLEHNNLSLKWKSFPLGVFGPLKSLRHLNAKYNDRDGFLACTNVITNLKQLEKLEIDVDESPDCPNIDKGFSNLTNLKSFRTGYCDFTYLSSYTFENMKYLQFIDISRCSISEVHDGSFQDQKQLKVLNISHINFDIYDISTIVENFRSTPIQKLIMTRTLRDTVSLAWDDFFNCLKQSGIKELQMGGNSFVYVIVKYPLPPTLEIFDLSYNNLNKFQFEMPNLMQLKLQNNGLGKFLASNRYSKQSSKRLEYVDLSFNVIHKLHFTIFHDHPKLKTINLSYNILTDISFDFSTLRSLEMLNLSHNKILAFSEESRNAISNIAKSSSLKIDLSKNNLQCGCNTFPFIQWMLENRYIFIGIDTYRCNWMNNSVITIFPLRPIVLQLEKECTSYTVLIACITSGIALSCVVLVGGLAYRYRWRLRYVYHMTRSKYKRYRPILDEGHYTYDAFISYSDEEQEFLLKDIIPNLEQKEILKLCIHQRDFLPGEDITQNITNAIHESKKTVCIITRSFLDSYYCMFEFNMARMESIYSRGGQNILFLVFLEQIRPSELPLVMLELVQKQSYIEYPNDEQGNVVFWDKIKEL